MLTRHAPCQVGGDAVILAAGIHVQVYHALLGRIPRLDIQGNPVGGSIHLGEQACLLDELVTLHQQRGIHNEVESRVHFTQIALHDSAVSQMNGQIEHLVQIIIGIDDKVESHVIGQAAMAVVGIITEVLRERTRQHVLDRGDYRIEIILARNKAIDVVAVDADYLLITIVIGIQLQLIEVYALAMIIGKSEFSDLDVARGIVQGVSPERGSSLQGQLVVGILAEQPQLSEIQPIGQDIDIVGRVGTIEQGVTLDVDTAIGVIHRDHTREVVTLLIDIGGNVMIPPPLEVHKGDMAIQVARHVTATQYCVDLGIKGNLVNQFTLGEEGTQLQPGSLDMTSKPRCPLLAGHRAIEVGRT